MSLRRALAFITQRFHSPQPKPLILVYHRIAKALIDPWGLAVTPAHFDEHLRVLRRTRRPMPLTQFVRELVAGSLPANAVAITFDDGYADNLLAAKPRLAAAGIPATVFLATGYIERPGEFWWDELAGLLLLEDRARSLTLVVGDHTLSFELETVTAVCGGETWRAWSSPLTRRQAAFVAIWDTLRHLEAAQREIKLHELRSIFSGRERRSGAGRALTRAEARVLASDGLVSIGAHTITHPLLTQLSHAERLVEIAESKAACEAIVGKPVTAFAYPYGDLDAEVRATVATTGFAIACSAVPGAVTTASDVLALPRIQVLDWDGDAFAQALGLGPPASRDAPSLK